MELPGQNVTSAELEALGFLPLILEVRCLEVPYGAGCEWTTIDEVPKAPGLYAFTVEAADQLRVAYVGKTEHLWMVTKGRLPNGAARPAQRYGRPKYAGDNRRRINDLIANQLRAGRTVRHWVLPMANLPADRLELNRRLLLAEKALIDKWDLRRVGWNRR
jgi:hypothetical protein